MDSEVVSEQLKANLLLECSIKDVDIGVRPYEKDCIIEFHMEMNDPVQTKLYIRAVEGSKGPELKIELSQNEKVTTVVRKTYLDSTIPF